MIELDKIYNEDCLIGMQRIPSGSVDAVICDLPYGTMKGLGKGTDGYVPDKYDWDEILPTKELFAEYDRVLRQNGMAVLFSQEPYTTHLRSYPQKSNLAFCYPLIYKKDSAGNALIAKTAPLSFFEDINVFAKPYDGHLSNPMRQYFAKVLDFIGKQKTTIKREIGEGADHVFRVDSAQFALCTAETYAAIEKKYGIDKMDGYRTYEDLKREDLRRTFNLPRGKSSFSNVLEFRKDKNTFHPTQKPIALISRLVLTYTNEGDIVLDNCIGSGTTAIACIREKRHFIGFETNKEYFDAANKRIKAELQQKTLF